jgi:hypothetical protein
MKVGHISFESKLNYLSEKYNEKSPSTPLGAW